MQKTAEYVSPHHPDKICDRISDAILDECLKQDPESRVAIETMGGHGIITVTGEMTTEAFVDIPKIARKITGDESIGVQVNVVKQSQEIARGVDTGGAGDQGIMVGYACRDNDAMMPDELFVARSLCLYIWGKNKELCLDGKTQITMDGKNITSVIVSFEHLNKEVIEDYIRDFKESVKERGYTFENCQYHVNPAGDWDIGGFDADTGLTGRKLAVDNYGTRVPIGGGAFSGKDPSKVDRSAAYKARQLAVQELKKADPDCYDVTVKISYAIGVAEPTMISIEKTYYDESGDTKKVVQGNLMEKLEECKPKNIIEDLELKTPQYLNLASFGHFGEDNIWDK